MLKKWKLITSIVVIYIVGIVGNSYYQYQSKKSELLGNIDRQLYSSAYGASIIIGEDFHNNLNNKSDLTESQFLEIADKLTKFNKSMETDYIYTFIEKEGDIYFTSTSLKDDEWDNAYKNNFFLKYRDGSEKLRDAFIDLNIKFETTKII
jgi:hypothetical protein